MAEAVYILSALTTLLCAGLLLSAYRRVQKRLLLWSGLCFAGLTIGNVLVFIDLVLVPTVDLYPLRLSITAIAIALLLYGLIWEGR